MISNGLRWLLWKGQSTPKGSQLTTWEPVFYMVCARSLYSRGSCNFLIFFFFVIINHLCHMLILWKKKIPMRTPSISICDWLFSTWLTVAWNVDRSEYSVYEECGMQWVVAHFFTCGFVLLAQKPDSTVSFFFFKCIS